jgi:hypothetical protein
MARGWAQLIAQLACSPPPQQRDDLPRSLPQKSYPRAQPHREVVGWLNSTNHAATHPNSKGHDGGHASGAHAYTDGAPEQAHIARAAAASASRRSVLRPCRRERGSGMGTRVSAIAARGANKSCVHCRRSWTALVAVARLLVLVVELVVGLQVSLHYKGQRSALLSLRGHR